MLGQFITLTALIILSPLSLFPSWFYTHIIEITYSITYPLLTQKAQVGYAAPSSSDRSTIYRTGVQDKRKHTIFEKLTI